MNGTDPTSPIIDSNHQQPSLNIFAIEDKHQNYVMNFASDAKSVILDNRVNTHICNHKSLYVGDIKQCTQN